MFNRIIIAGILLALCLVFGGCDQKTAPSYTPANANDQNWVNGIANAWTAGFLVKDAAAARNDLRVGSKVTFSDGTVRTIVKLKELDGALIVFLDGAPLDGNMVGYPKTVKITDAVR
jgi:endoglucanase